MSEEQKVEVNEQPVDDKDVIDVLAPDGIPPKAFWYEVKAPGQDPVQCAIISASSTDAREGLKQRLPEGSSILYKGVSTVIMQF